MTTTYALSPYEAEVLTGSLALADYFESVARAHGDAKTASNFVMGEVLAALKARGEEIASFPIGADRLAGLLDLVRAGTLSVSAAKHVVARMLESGEAASAIVEREGLAQISDDDALRGWIDEVLRERAAEAARFAAGERKLLGVLVGAVMKKSGGRADPRRVNQMLAERTGS